MTHDEVIFESLTIVFFLCRKWIRKYKYFIVLFSYTVIDKQQKQLEKWISYFQC